jgi:hypothetical protein
MFWYTVQSQDTLYHIAKNYETTIERIMELNHLPTTQIFLNQQLLIDDINNIEAAKIVFDRVYDADMNKYVNIYKIDDKKALFFTSKMAIDADGSPRTYHLKNAPGTLADIRQAGRPGKWWEIATENGRPDGKPCIQKYPDPFPGFCVSSTTLNDKNRPFCDYRKYVNSEKIPYIALPPKMEKKWGVRLGDFAVVINRRNMKMAYAIYADWGPNNKIGEGSIKLAELLGIKHSPPRVGGTGKESYVLYIVFPKSGVGPGILRPLNEINRQGQQEFEAWGGINQVYAVLR